MASQLKTYLALQGCELTVIFHDAKTWDGCQQLADADIMMGDRLIGEAPEYTLEQWLRCDALWPHVLAHRLTPICKPRWMRYRLRPRLGIGTRA
jgi:MarR-like DNA-binding transcriptional regulator SgrR of sgrS sRNA